MGTARGTFPLELDASPPLCFRAGLSCVMAIVFGGARLGPTRRSPCKQRRLSPPGRQFGLSLYVGSVDLPMLQLPGAFAVGATSSQLLRNLTDASGNPSMLRVTERGDPSFSP